jgi:hypothetical protein
LSKIPCLNGKIIPVEITPGMGWGREWRRMMEG